MKWISTRRPILDLWLFGVLGLLGPGCGSQSAAPARPSAGSFVGADHDLVTRDSNRPAPTARPMESASSASTELSSSRPASPANQPPVVNDAPPTAAAPHTEPAAVKPPFPASARPGDGEWVRYSDAMSSEHTLWRTTLHPHRTSAFVSVSVVAMDLRAFDLEWVVGTADDGADKLASKMTVGLITGDAVAVFNGGFQARHGHWGQVSHGVTLVEPRPEGCGVALTADGQVELGPYADVSPLAPVTIRQTPPCLVVAGAINAALLAGRDEIWAGKSEREKTRRRSALGLRRSSSTLYYLVGVEVAAIDLARALVALGADVGLQLDINWNWTRFFLVGQKDGSPEVHSPLLEGMVMDAGEYVKRPSKRDFFVVKERR